MSDALSLLRIDIASTFVLSPQGRILRENDPDHSAGPRLYFAGCEEGNCLHLRHDVREDLAARAHALLGTLPPWHAPEALPAAWPAWTALFGPDAAPQPSLIFTLPPQPEPAGAHRIVCSGTPEGARWLDAACAQGLPPHLVAAGFKARKDFWAPWCVLLDDDGAVAATAFAARLGEQGAEAGVYTFPAWRGRGLAGVVTAAWSRLPALRGRALFYSTAIDNRASQQVARKLGLRQLGAGLRAG